MDRETMGRSLLAALATVPDPRLARGRRHPLPAVLALATTAMLCGARSLYAIAQWGRLQPPAVARALGFTRERTPAVSTLHEVFSQLDAAAFETALRTWAQGYFGDRREAIALDGKALRGIHGEALPGVDLVAAYATEAGLVLAQAGGEAGSGRDRAGRGAGAAGAAAPPRSGRHRRRAALSAGALSADSGGGR